MVVAGDTPAGVDGLEDIGLAIAIAVLDAGELGALGEVERAVFPIHAERLVETAGEFLPGDLGNVIAIGAGADPEIAAAGGDGHLFVRHQGDGADLHDLAGREWDFLAGVEIGLLLGEGRGGEGD